MIIKNPLYSFINIPGDSDFNITEYKRDNKKTRLIKNHFHNIYEIVLYKDINGSVYLNGTEDIISKWTLLYVPPYAVHGFSLKPQVCEYIVLHLSNSFSLEPARYPLLINLTDSSHIMIKNLLLWGNDKSLSYEYRSEIVRMILLWIIEQKTIRSYSFKKRSEYFTPLLKFINDKRIYNISTEEACKMCNMSRSSFISNFKRSFNMNFHHFLTEKRIEEAIHLLKNSEMNCSEISAELGFSDASHFSRVFKKITGYLPKNFI